MALRELHRDQTGPAAALHWGDPAFDALPAYFQQHLGPALQSLLTAAADAGEMRADVRANDLLRTVSNLCVPDTEESVGHSQRVIGLLIDGPRYGARSPAPVPEARPKRKR